jgi:autotransporter-associated beta strand protein
MSMKKTIDRISRKQTGLLLAALSVSSTLLCVANPARAGQQYLDNNGTSPGYGDAPISPGSINWLAGPTGPNVWTPTNDTSGISSPTYWTDGNDALFALSTTNVLNVSVAGNVNPNSLNFLTSETVNINNNTSTNALVTLGNSAGNGGILLYHGGTVSILNSIAAAAPVNISADSNGGTTLNFGTANVSAINNFSGGIIISTPEIRVNFNDTGASGVGANAGPITITAPDVIVTNANTILSNPPTSPTVITIPNAISINPNNVNPVTITHNYGFYASLSSTTFATSSAGNNMTFSGPISGNGGVIAGNGDYTSGGGNNITVFSNSNNTYTGQTIIGMTGGKFNLGAPAWTSYGSLRMGANQALPATTDVIFGLPNVSKAYGSLDLNGYNLTVNSISNMSVTQTTSGQVVTDNYVPGGGTTAEAFAGVTNDTNTLSTLTILSSAPAPAYPLVLDAPIGIANSDLGDSTNATPGTKTATNNIALVYNSNATMMLGQPSTYTGGTTIQNGTLALADTYGGNDYTGGLSSSGALTFSYGGTNTSGGTLDLAGVSQQVSSLNSSGGAGTITSSYGAMATFTVNNSGTNAYSGVIADGASQVAFTKAGTGTLTLSGVNTYSGPTAISSGSLIVNGSLGTSSSVTVASNAILGGKGTINGSVTLQTGAILAPGELAAISIGSLTVQPGADLRFDLGASSAASDSVNVLNSNGLVFQPGSRSAVEIFNGGGLSSGTYHLFDYNGNLTGGLANLLLYPLPAGFSGTLAVDGNYIDLDVTQLAAKTWTGAVGGNWNTTEANFTPSNYSDSSHDAVIFPQGANTANVTIAPSPVSPSAITFSNTTQAYTLGGAAITGSSSITINGGGSVTLTGSNSFTGIIVNSSGTLNISADDNLGDPGNGIVLAGAGTPAALVIAGTFSSNRELTLRGAGTVSVASGQTWTESGQLDSSGSLTKTGAGSLILSCSTNSYVGFTNVSGGTLQAGAINTLPSTTDLSVSSGAVFNTSSYSQTVGSIAGSGSIILGSGATLTTSDAVSTTFSGAISGPGTLMLAGTGTLILSGTSTFGGAGQTVTLSSGQLNLSTDAALGDPGNALSLNAGATLSLNTATFSSNRSIGLTYTGSATTTPPVNVVLTGTGTSTLNGQITGSGGLAVTGSGTLNLNNASNTFAGGLTIATSTVTVAVSNGNALGSGEVTLQNGGILDFTSTTSTSNNFQINVNGGTFNTGGNTVTVNGLFGGAQASGVTKLGSGTLILAGAGALYSGQWAIKQGIVEVNASSNGITGLGTEGNDTGGLLPNNSVTTTSTGYVEINNVILGNYNDEVSSPRIYLANTGGAGGIIGTGNASYGYDGGGIYVTKGANASNPTITNISTLNPSDVLTINNQILQYDPNNLDSGVTNAIIKVNGPGTVILQNGDVNGNNTHNNTTAPNLDYAGSWQISSGVLQLGPVIPQPNPQGVGGRPFGEPLNALGFVNGDPEQANPVTLTGGTLALGVDAPNMNPGFTNTSAGTPANPTPDYLRNPVTLAGGALASTGFETTYNTTVGTTAPQGIPSTIRVSGQFGGNFNVAAGTTSYIDTFDPASPSTAMSVELVAGSRYLVSTKTTNYYTTSWNGNLVVTPGASSTGGSFDITRTAGTIAVTPGATVTVQAGSTLNVGTATISGAATQIAGTIDPFTDSTSTGNSTAKSVALTVAGTLDYATASGDAIAGKSLSLDRLAGLTLQPGGQVTINTAASSATRTLLVTSSLSVAPSATLNLGNSDLIVQGGSLANVTSLVATGYNSGLWTGTGVTSSAAAADPSHLTALGVIQNNQSGPALYTASNTFDGTTPGASDILVKYTYYGDTNLDGKVDGSDYSRIDAAYLADQQTPGSETGWFNGDFNYDGVIDGSDYTLIDNAFNTQGAQISAAIASPTAQISGGVGSSAVPEPATLSLLAIVSVGLLSRRKRN